MVSMASARSDILLYLTVCGKGWLVIYLSWLLITSILTSLTLHLMAVGLSICVVAALKLPTPDPDTVKMVVGEEPDEADTDTAGKETGLHYSHPAVVIFLSSLVCGPSCCRSGCSREQSGGSQVGCQEWSQVGGV